MTKPLDYEVAIVGGGPAGLAAGIGFARRGFSTVIIEKNEWPIDKACGEGLMPDGVAELERLGVLPHLDASYPFKGVELVSKRGTRMPVPFRNGNGLGIRRTALSQALFAVASQELNLICMPRTKLLSIDHKQLTTSKSNISYRFLVGADGLRSQVRKLVATEVPTKVRRYGATQHFEIAPWSQFVEVYFSDGIEAYVTPCGDNQVGVAFLWHYDRFSPTHGRAGLIAQCLSHFPNLKERLSNCVATSETQTIGPMRRKIRVNKLPGIALLGDAAGYHDAITGEGVSLSLLEARALVERYPHALGSYQKAQRRLKSKANLLTGSALFLSRRPYLQDAAFRLVSRFGLLQ